MIGRLGPALQIDAAAGLAEGWAAAEPARAAAWAATLDEETKGTALPGVVSQWARRAPQEAAAFAQANDSRGDLVTAVAQEWMPYSPDLAGRWVDKLPPGDARDAGLSSIGQIVANEDPAAAVLWISRMTSAPRREQELQYMCSQWIQIDPAAAKAWIGGSNLSADTKASLLR
jgi:ferric-dicitrate binding protein FerR (iron transport regulator)